MSIACMNHVWANAQHSATELLVLLAIADFADDRGMAFPSVATLAAKSRTTERNAQRVLAKLQAAGSLSVAQGKGPFGTNLYTVNMGGDKLPPPANCRPDSQGKKGVTPAPPKPSIEPITSSLQSEEGGKRRKSASVRIPADFTPNETAQEMAQRLGVDLSVELRRFRDHAEATGRLLIDWQAGFRMWLDKSQQFSRAGGPRPARNQVDYAKGLPPAKGGR